MPASVTNSSLGRALSVAAPLITAALSSRHFPRLPGDGQDAVGAYSPLARRGSPSVDSRAMRAGGGAVEAETETALGPDRCRSCGFPSDGCRPVRWPLPCC